MTSPRVEVNLDKIRLNTRCLVDRLKPRGITVTAVTKAVCGRPSIAQAMLDGGAVGLAEARISNVQRLRRAGLTCPISMIRSPMLSQVDQVIQSCDVSYNSERVAIAALAEAAVRAGTTHSIVLMVEMGDRREGIMPEDLATLAQNVISLPGVVLWGIAANFACLSGVGPNADTMRKFSNLATQTEGICGPFLATVSGGNSASLSWALGSSPSLRINNLRLGEAILLGKDPMSGEDIGGLYRDAFTLVIEVIETKHKPDQVAVMVADPVLKSLRLLPAENHLRSIVALGRQDTEIEGLSFPEGTDFLGATSDHMVIRNRTTPMPVGSELRLGMNYEALMRIMAAPDTVMEYIGSSNGSVSLQTKRSDPCLHLV